MTKLPVFKTIKEALAAMFNGGFYLLRQAWLMILLVITGSVIAAMTGPEPSVWLIIPAIAFFLLLLPLTIRTHEYVVDGTTRSPMACWKFKPRQLGLYVVYTLYMFLATLPIMFLMFLAIKFAGAAPFVGEGIILLSIIVLVPISLVISLAYPAVSTNRSITIREAYATIKGNLLRFFSASALLYLLLFIITFIVLAGITFLAAALQPTQSLAIVQGMQQLIMIPSAIGTSALLGIVYRTIFVEEANVLQTPAPSQANATGIDPQETS